MAKGITNGAVPMGAVFVKRADPRRLHERPPSTRIEFFHGYTYSAHPARLRGRARHARDLRATKASSTRARRLAQYWEDAVHSLKGAPHVIDIRNLGLVAGIELEPRAGAPGPRAYEALVKAFETGVLIRVTADIIAAVAAAHCREAPNRSAISDASRGACSKWPDPLGFQYPRRK